MTRAAHMRSFLAEAGWGSARIQPLAGDASQRAYHRLTGTRNTAILMDAPPDRGEDIRPFAAMTRWLTSQGFSPPQILSEDAARGFLLLEDLGDTLYARVLGDGTADEVQLYSAAVDLLTDLAEIAPPDTIGTGLAAWHLPPYDQPTLDREAALATEWWLGRGAPAPGPRGEMLGLLREATAGIASVRSTVVLRDYHAENLIWLPDRAGPARVGLLDYQDALAGHAAYDLVSLLEDARRDTSADLQEGMLRRYLDRRPGLDPEAFRAAYAILGAQRNLKIIGIFARLALRDRKPRYLDLIPRVWAHLMADLEHPALCDLRRWVHRVLPPPVPALLSELHARSSAP